ncbi:hypothetical protein [Paenibacillus brevis]|uniref:Uncharacterized protein n=1 Tax=Paenibacillus brevis TaxID=2841508 RepID=A0ABS6FSI4_9BACL|nr:hypothetical protein [Paenibacillus brevis]MBU5673197.1 hypothetical protein [Paenibacillus brevis]
MKNIGLLYKDLENLGFIEYQHANLDLEEESSPSSGIETQEIAHEAIIRAVAKMIEANNAELLKHLKSAGVLLDQ